MSFQGHNSISAGYCGTGYLWELDRRGLGKSNVKYSLGSDYRYFFLEETPFIEFHVVII